MKGLNPTPSCHTYQVPVVLHNLNRREAHGHANFELREFIAAGEHVTVRGSESAMTLDT
jgi:hypothetical protein